MRWQSAITPHANADVRKRPARDDGLRCHWRRLHRGGQDDVDRGVPGVAGNTPAKGKPTITGTVHVGKILTAQTSDIFGANGMSNASFSYQWVSGGSDISGATDSSYVPTSHDEGWAGPDAGDLHRRHRQRGDPYH